VCTWSHIKPQETKEKKKKESKITDFPGKKGYQDKKVSSATIPL
jgi:hypothetical protein